MDLQIPDRVKFRATDFDRAYGTCVASGALCHSFGCGFCGTDVAGLIPHALELLFDDGVRSESTLGYSWLPVRWRHAACRVNKKSPPLRINRILRCPTATSGSCCLVMIRQPLGCWLFKMFQRRSSLRLRTLAYTRDVHIPLQRARTFNVAYREASTLALALFQIPLPLLPTPRLLLQAPVVETGLAVKDVVLHRRRRPNPTISLGDAVRLQVHHPPIDGPAAARTSSAAVSLPCRR